MAGLPESPLANNNALDIVPEARTNFHCIRKH